MDISSLGGAASTYNYVNRSKNKQDTSLSFKSFLNMTTSADITTRKEHSFENMWKTKFPGVKFQEVRLIGSTSVGTSYTGTTIECASFEEDDEKKKIWTITCVDAEGISSKKCQNGKVLSSWQLKYKSSEDANRVDEFLAEFKNDENLRFTGIKVFWTMFLGGNTSKDDLTFSGGAWEWTQ